MKSRVRIPPTTAQTPSPTAKIYISQSPAAASPTANTGVITAIVSAAGYALSKKR